MSTLCTVLNSSTDKGVMVSSRLGSPPEAVGEASLLDLVMFQAIRSIHRRSGKKEQMTSYAAVDLTATRRVVRAWPSFSWLVVPIRHVTPVLCVHASPSHMVSVFVLRLS